MGFQWNTSIMLVSLAILFNVLWWIYKHPRLKYKRLFYFGFTLMSVLLFMVGLFPIGHYKLMHDIPAYGYFMLYPLTIFTMTFLNRKNIHYGEWASHMTLSMIMIILPLIFLERLEGVALAEILHTVVVIVWNLTLFKKIKLHHKIF